MITKSTATTDNELYALRFEKIDEAFKNAYPDDPEVIAANEANVPYISNLDTFFSRIKDIGAMNDGLKYLLMPLDEPLFEIDANTREINVPEHFAKYGIGVQEDQKAETVYFIIDRFFDYTDFSDCDISINWKLSSSNSKVTPTGRAQALVKTTDNIDGINDIGNYVIFGWVIDDDMTKFKGNLTFSVTISKQLDNDFYCFNTKPVTVAINEGLTFETEPQLKSYSSSVLALLTNSSYATGGAAPVAKPVWTVGESAEGYCGIVELVGEAIKEAFSKKINLPTQDDEDDEKVTLVTQAYAENATSMEYSWKYAPYNADKETFGPDQEVTTGKSIVYLVTKDTKVNYDNTYYVKVSEGVYNLATPAQVSAYINATADERLAGTVEKIYEKYYTCEASQPGRYIASVQGFNRVSSTVKSASSNVSSEAVIVPYASAPAVEMSVLNEADSLTNGYSVEESANANYVSAYLSEDGDTELKATFALSEGMTSDDIGKYTYMWQRSNSHIGPWFDIEDSSESDSIEVSENYYRVAINHRKNKTSAVSDYSKVYRFTAIAPKITDIKIFDGLELDASELGTEEDYYLASLKNGSRTVKVSAILEDDAPAEASITYQWQKCSDENQLSLESAWESASNGTNYYATVRATGFYRVKVMVHYNNSVYTAVSKVIKIA